MFKIGDKVIVVDAESVGGYYENGDIGVVSKIDSKLHGYVTRNDGVEMNVYWREVELYKQPGVFQAGDRVKFTESSLASGMIDAKEGDVFTVHDMYNRTVSLKELPGDYHDSHFEHYVEKENVMEKYIPKVGDKVKGFKFNDDSYSAIGYIEPMDDFVGKQGTVHCVIEDQFYIDFGDNCWAYPLELAHLAKIEESSKIEEPAQGLSHEDSQIDWQGSQINWQVGQEVWDVLRGKGVVFAISTNSQNPVGIKFDSGSTTHAYRDGSLLGQNHIRTLFFSEPKIIAETMPPKKPFLPTLKEGDKVVIQTTDCDFIATIVSEDEEEIFIKRQVSGIRYPKNCIKVYKLGEQVKFS